MSSGDQWVEKFSSREQRIYYFNVQTGESSWECPIKPGSSSGNIHARVDPEVKKMAAANENGQASSSSTVLQGSSERNATGPASKRARSDDDSYAPPISGSAADAIVQKPENLPTPVITADLPPSAESMWVRQDIQVNKYLADTYVSGEIKDANGELKKFKDITNPIQGRHIYNLIYQNRFQRTLEVGLAMGASAVWICQAHKDLGLHGTHVAIDPNQTSQYENIGRILVQRSGLESHMSVMEMTSYRALPKLLEEVLAGRQQRFHLIYIDGWHTFDYTLVDFFYADLLLETNGVIVLDDIKHKPVQKCLKYIEKNYPHYQVVPRTPCFSTTDAKISSQATFIKTDADSRAWNYHVEF